MKGSFMHVYRIRRDRQLSAVQQDSAVSCRSAEVEKAGNSCISLQFRGSSDFL
jgi:hypothetical protein